jgi:hypothetical protein
MGESTMNSAQKDQEIRELQEEVRILEDRVQGLIEEVKKLRDERKEILKKTNLVFTEEAPFPVENGKCNPFHYDLFNMGQPIAKDYILMFPMHGDQEFQFLILVNTLTGERWKIEEKS